MTEEETDTIVFCGLSQSAYDHYKSTGHVPLSERTFAQTPGVIEQVLEGYEMPSDLYESVFVDIFPKWADSGVNASFFYDDAQAFGEYVVEAKINGTEFDDYVILPGGLIIVREVNSLEVLEVYKDHVRGKVLSILRENTQNPECFGRYSHSIQPKPIVIPRKKKELILESVLDILTEKKERILREITEDEMEHIAAALDDMSPESLAFNKAFDGKTRIVLDFPTMDTESDLGGFVDQYQKQGYKVDWEKGVISGEQELRQGDGTKALVAVMLGGEPAKHKKRKIQIKIGKFWAKIADLASKKKVLTDKVLDFAKNNRDKLPMKFGERVPTTASQITGTMAEHVFSDEELERYHQLSNQLAMYLPNPGRMPVFHPAGDKDLTGYAKKMQKYWQENAGYIKKEIDSLETDQYSIIITRHPIDVLRMSDFDSISSCHSPPSRSHSEGEYYKCAVAEAHGHGAIAYVVETADLLATTDSGDLKEAEGKIQDGELFADDARIGNHPHHENLEPVSRLRIRQVRYYSRDESERTVDGVEVAIPETRVYGKGIPGLPDRITDWAKENQEEQLANMPRTPDGYLDLSSFTRFGGDYEDNNINVLIKDFTGEDTSGETKNDTMTQDDLDVNLVGSLIDQWTARAEEIADNWNTLMKDVQMDPEVEDDGADHAYIRPRALLRLKFKKEDFIKYPSYDFDWGSVVSEINDMGYEYFDSDRVYPVNQPNGLLIQIPIMIEYLDGDPSGGSGYLSDPEDLDDIGAEINKIDDLENDHHIFSSFFERVFRREGLMSGGGFLRWAQEIESGEAVYGEWDVEAEDVYYDEDGGEIVAEAIVEVDISEFVNRDDSKIRWNNADGHYAAYIGNNIVARVYSPDPSQSEVEVTDSPVDSYYDSFAKARDAIQSHYVEDEYVYDKIKSVLNGRDFSISLKKTIIDAEIRSAHPETGELVTQSIRPTNAGYPWWSINSSLAHENPGIFDVTIQLKCDSDEDDRIVEVMKRVCEEWDDIDELKSYTTKVAHNILRNALGTQKSIHQHLNENQRLVSTWKDFLRG